VKVVVILTAAIALFDVVNRVRKVRGRALLFPQFLGMRGPRAVCLIALAGTLAVATVVEVIARGI
jgi:hypothetical protein